MSLDMRRIVTLVRHAKSSWKHPELNDFDRPLNNRGLKNAPEMGRRLAEANYKVELIISSPAVRAITTAKFIARELGIDVDSIRTEDTIYEASANSLLYLISSLDDTVQRVMLVGHNPGFTMLCNNLSDTDIVNLPTCAIAQIVFNMECWSSINEHTGKLLEFDYPKKP